jgi:hypothetical protein
MAKGQHVQDGFDAGFPVGAQMGMRAGTILGIMEGLLRGFEERSGPGVVKKPVVRSGTATSGGSTSTQEGKGNMDEVAELHRQRREQVRSLYQAALKELDVQAVFAGAGGEGAAASGMPVEVVPESKSKEGESAEAQLARKGDVVISKWERRVAVPRWEENMEALEMKEKEKENKSKGERTSASAFGAGASAAQAVEQS